MTFFPKEIMKLIYEYDPTYRDIYNNVIKDIKILPKFIKNFNNVYIFQIWSDPLDRDQIYVWMYLNPYNYYMAYINKNHFIIHQNTLNKSFSL